MTLNEFLASKCRAYHLKEQGFHSLYVRKGRRYIDGQVVDKVFDIASIDVTKPGTGTFTRFLDRIPPDYGIYVENVFPLYFRDKLLKLGFKQVTDTSPPSFYRGPECD
jgi:hypothetical protein